MYLIRLKPNHNESLLSYLSRTAEANEFSLTDVIKDVKRKKYILRIDRLYLIDLYPHVTLDLEVLAERTQQTEEQLLQMTCYYAFSKFSHSEKESYSRFMNGLTRRDLFYCPKCLIEHNYIRLMWKIDGINLCLKHHCKLSQKCDYCGDTFDLNKIQADNCCPSCKVFLGQGECLLIKDVSALLQQKWLVSQWEYLLRTSTTFFSPRDIAHRVAFLLQNINQKLTLKEACANYEVNYQELLQFARGTLNHQRSFHLHKLLNVLFKCEVEIHQFLSITIPEQISSQLSSSASSVGAGIDHAVCLAPWCPYYNSGEFLKKTGTRYKKLKDGSVQKNYLFCTHCGCTYYFDEQGSQFERDGFIDGFNIIHSLNIEHIQNDKQFKLGSIPNSVWAYFQTRLENHILIEKELLDRVIKAIIKGNSLNQIKSWSCWTSADQYLLYRYHIDVLRVRHFKKREVTKPKKHTNQIAMLIHVTKHFLDKDETITLNKFASYLEISPTTLQNWNEGYVEYTNAKALQKSERLKKRKEQLIIEIDRLIENQKFTGTLLRAKDIYDHLGMKQSYLCDWALEITRYITHQVGKHNNTLKS